MRNPSSSASARLVAVGLLCLILAAAAYAALPIARGPQPIFMHVRWAPNVTNVGRQEAEERHGLSDGEQLEGRTWGYTLNDPSTANIRAVVTNPAIEDTQDVDRTAFRPSATAEKRPYPHSLLPVSLWGVTALCLFVGLTSVTLGLTGQPLAATTTVRTATPPAAAGRWTVTERLALFLVVALVGICFLIARTSDLRVDENNHLSQIQRYASGNFETRSTASGGFHATAALFARLTGSSAKENIRLLVLLIAAATILTFRSVVTALEPGTGTVRTLQFALFPLLFPFWFLIYTDVLALLLLLLAILALTRHRFHATGLLMILSMAVRQIYVVWLAMLGVWTVVTNFALPARELVKRGLSFVIAAALFALFVLINDGVAIGDRDSHPDMELHTENLLFMLVCFFLTFFPLIVSKLPQIARLRRSLLIGITLASFVIFFVTFRVDHPYNVMTEGTFLRNQLLEIMTASAFSRVLTSVVIALAALSLFVIRLHERIHYLIYPFAALSVMPVWLIEQRYYLAPFALFMLFRESASPGVERALLVTNGIMAVYLFEGVTRGLFFL